ncbi:MAG TPA: DUF6259 domain-containing protein [Candidatus Hydrogenedentes bacterium]|nr:DUF6259 domain-containing protein [Candidatus Hydrogenedentota bacterium]
MHERRTLTHAAGALCFIGGLVCAGFAAETGREVLASSRLKAEFENGAVVVLSDAEGRVFAACENGVETLPCLHRIDETVPGEQARSCEPEESAGTKTWTLSGFGKLPGTRVRTTVSADADELVIQQQAECPQKGLWGVEWSVPGIPLDQNIIVPGHSGVRLTAATPGSWFTFDYPMSWEAQLVIVEGEGAGFYVWARDPDARFKRLAVERSRTGWRLRFVSMAYAPFEETAGLTSPEWRIGAYTGDWRVPARRYRDWMVREFAPTRLEEQQPAWLKDIRCFVITGLDLEGLENLGKNLDPAQTIVYVPGWRSQGYDRDYPDYDEVIDGVRPFIEHAHALGFRVMLHVNYFGVDPLNALYPQFEPYHVRSPWGKHEKEWWLWTRAKPEIKFAYINPACKAWRDLFVERMSRLCAEYAVDALHLDQTLCIYNDQNGRIDGMTMAEGNIALHQQLRQALPGVALSGEGLNEITYRHEAFAQRHAWGVHHSEGTWDRALLAAAHPVASYLFRPYTIINGYLGCAPPASGQLYAAWNEAYEHWGVIPTFKPSPGSFERPAGFERQFRDETAFWFEARPEIALEDPWPETTAFPYRTKAGDPIVRTTDHRLVAGGRVVSQTISEAEEVALPGTIPGWRAYDDTRLFGLDPEAWYPYFGNPRDLAAPHLAALPEAFRPTSIILDGGTGIVRTEQRGGVVADIAALLGEADRGARLLDGSQHALEGDGTSPDGAFFEPHGNVLHAHPPWKQGTGETYARLEIALPKTGKLLFESTVGMDKGAVGQTDGVTFSVRAESNGETFDASVHTDAAEPVPLALDLTPCAGRTIALELSVNPGPANSPSFDWARWYDARVSQRLCATGTLVLAGTLSYTHAAAGGELVPIQGTGTGLAVDVPLPGAAYFISGNPIPVTLPGELASRQFETVFAGSLGQRLEAPPHATARPANGQVNGAPVTGLFVHPPNEGVTVVVFFLVLPSAPSLFEAFVGLRDGAEESNGVECAVEVNGLEMVRSRARPGDGLVPMRAGLERWAAKPVVLTLTTDSAGPYNCDWVMWATPRICEAP